MDDAKLAELLGKVGHETFVEYYPEFCDWSVPDESLRGRLLADSWNARKGQNGGAYTLGTCRTKVSKGRRIICAGRGADALRLIAASSKNQTARNYALVQLNVMEE